MTIPERKPKELQKDYAMRAIRDGILNWELTPGMLVSENKLADMLGISRIPVREALKELAKTKIVEIYPQRGTRIAPLDFDLIHEAEFARRVMECAMVQLACEVATEEDFAWFEENLKEQVAIWESGTYQQQKDIDQVYHRHYFEICNKMQCYEAVQSMNIHFDRVRHISYILQGSAKLVDDHRKIFEAVRDRDSERAQALVVKHLVRYEVEREETYRMCRELIEKFSH